MRQHVFGQMSADRPARQHHNVTLAVLALSGAAYALLQSLVAPALPDIQHSLHTTEGGVTWVLTSYLVSASVATPILGRLGDIHGKERFMLVSVGLLATGTLLCALAHSLPVMIAGRVEAALDSASSRAPGAASSRWRSGSSATSSRATASRAASA